MSDQPVHRLRSRPMGGGPVRGAVRPWRRAREAPGETMADAALLGILFDPWQRAAHREDAACGLIRRHLGITMTPGWRRDVAALRQGRAVGRRDGAALAGIAAVYVLRAVAEGRRVHVLDMGLRAVKLAERLGPLLDACGFRWACQSEEATAWERAAGYEGDVLFGRPQQVALDILLARVRERGTRSGLRGAISRMTARLDVSPGPRPEALDLVLVLDGEAALCSRALTSIMASEREIEGAPSLSAEEALGIAAQLGPRDFRLSERDAALTRAGRERLATMAGTLGPDWLNAARGELAVRRALMALHLWREGEHYYRQDGGIVTVAAELSAEGAGEGLAPADFLMLKERLAPQETRRPVERMPLRGLFLRYRGIAVMADAARLHAPELRAVHGLRRAADRIEWPRLMCHDPADLPAMIAALGPGPVLPVVLGRTEADVDAIAESLNGAVLFDAGALPEGAVAAEHGEVRGGLVWMGRPGRAALDYLAAVAGESCRLVVIGPAPGWWCAAGAEWRAILMAEASPAMARAGTLWRRLAIAAARGRWLAGPLHRLHARHHLRRAAKADRELRRMLFDFDRRTRETASFLHADRE